MRREVICVAAAAALSCGCGLSSSSEGEASEAEDSRSGDGGAGDESAPGSGGLGMMGALLSAQQNEPGFYEEPQKSEDFAEGEEHFEVLELSGKVVELTSLSLFGGAGGTELRTITEKLRELSEDESVAGLLLRVGDFSIGLTRAEELRAALEAFKTRGGGDRKVFCHTDRAADAVYYVLTACDRIGVAPNGQISLTGAAAMPIHLKELLDKLGVEADFVHIGAYKGAAEPLTRKKPSKEMLETLQAILDTSYETLVAGVAAGRSMDEAQVRELVSTALFPDQEAVDAGLADSVAVYQAFRAAELGETPWQTQPLKEQAVPQDMNKIMELLGLTKRKRPTEPHVALVYAVGSVVEGEGNGIIGARSEIAARTLSAALRSLGGDDSVKAIVLRIDSGGGSALASEIIWQAVEEVNEDKPVVVSMGSVAASGGYYIGCGADKIFADRTTLTGSIGVVGGKIVFGEGLSELGIHTYPIGKGKRALLWSPVEPWTDEERDLVRSLMEGIYTTFVARVAEGREMSTEAVKEVARGRVWTGEAAVENGLVDEIGGVSAALAEARELGEVPEEAPLEVYPPEPTLLDLLEDLGGGGGLPGAMEAATAEAGRVLGPEALGATRALLLELLRFREHPVRAVNLLPLSLP